MGSSKIFQYIPISGLPSVTAQCRQLLPCSSHIITCFVLYTHMCICVCHLSAAGHTHTHMHTYTSMLSRRLPVCLLLALSRPLCLPHTYTHLYCSISATIEVCLYRTALTKAVTCIHSNTNICICIHMCHSNMNICICIHLCMYVCIRTHTHNTHTHANIHTYIRHTCIHTYIHTYIHT